MISVMNKGFSILTSYNHHQIRYKSGKQTGYSIRKGRIRFTKKSHKLIDSRKKADS